jgi:hypothetical protein
VQWNILVGFPREGEDVYAKYVKDLQRLTHLYPPNGAFPVRFDRYSPYFTKAEEFGLKLKYLDYYALTFPFDKDSLTQMAYHFEDTNYSAPYIASMVKWIGRIREKTDAWRIRWGGAGHAGQPKLYLTRENDRGIVNDTRSNRAVKHELSANQVRLLEFIDNSQSFDSVRKEFGPDVDRDLEYLDERELTWAEGDRLMGLVILNEY